MGRQTMEVIYSADVISMTNQFIDLITGITTAFKKTVCERLSVYLRTLYT